MKKTKFLLLTAIMIALGSMSLNAQCLCNTWTFTNNTDCELELLAETPPPCNVMGAIGKVLPQETKNITPFCFSTDCGLVCPWAVWVKGSTFGMGQNDPNGTIYYNVIHCSSCPSGWVMATYYVDPVTGNYSLIFDCQP